MLIVVCQAIVLHPHLSSLFVFLVVVRCPCCHPSYSSLFVLLAVCHPPRLRRQGWRAIHPNIMLIVVFNSSTSVLIHCPLLSTPLPSSPLLSYPLLSASQRSSPLWCLWTHNHFFTVHTCDSHHTIVRSIHCTIKPSYHRAIVSYNHSHSSHWDETRTKDQWRGRGDTQINGATDLHHNLLACW